MDVTETDLPGVGKKHEIELRSGVRAVVLTQNTGDRELLCKHETDVDPERLLELTDREARVLGTVLEGAYFQPMESGDVGATFAEDMMIEWVTITESAPAVGKAVSTVVPDGVSVLALYQSEDLITDSFEETVLQPGDVIIVAGERDPVTAFEADIASPGN